MLQSALRGPDGEREETTSPRIPAQRRSTD
jgi:hypothetical protein